MALDAKELKRRIEAARTLRKVSQEDLNKLFARDGIDKLAAGRVERGEIDMQRVHLDAFVRHLRVPERWFTEPDVDIIVGLRNQASSDDLMQRFDALERALLGGVRDRLPGQGEGHGRAGA
jgi:transcriptional regulator with XRE-family HTH domain